MLKKNETRGPLPPHDYVITGMHSNALIEGDIISRIYMLYTPSPYSSKVTVTGSSISSNYSGLTWTPDKSGHEDFHFEYYKCHISLRGTVRYKPFYTGKQTMAGYVTKNYRGFLDGGKVERLH